MYASVIFPVDVCTIRTIHILTLALDCCF